MSLTQLDGNTLSRFLCAGASLLSLNKDTINALNVFPVPDGDTGTNMNLTITSAIKNLPADAGVGKVAAAASMGALMGARGNSGVILSQLFRGFSLEADNKPTLSAAEVAACWQKGVDTEVHHVKNLAKLHGNKKWEQVMISRHRKTLVLCKQCHEDLHNGLLD